MRACLLDIFDYTLPPPPRSPLFPYTTLFRSFDQSKRAERDADRPRSPPHPRELELLDGERPRLHLPSELLQCERGLRARSEEHTSELQSLTNLVCRLLLEKKKTHAAIISRQR